MTWNMSSIIIEIDPYQYVLVYALLSPSPRESKEILSL